MVEIPSLRVVETCDTKSNPVWYLDLFGAPALYAQPRTFPLKDAEVGGMTAADWEDMFKGQLARMLGMMLIATYGPAHWSKESPTGHDVHLVDVHETRD